MINRRFFNRLTISWRLMGSFGVAALFTLLASSLGIYTFISSTRSLQVITDEYVPYLSSAYELAVRSRAISAQALTLINAEYQSERQSAGYQIEDEFRLITELIEELKASNIVDLETLIVTRQDLLDSFYLLDKMVSEKIDKKIQLKKINRSVIRLSKKQETIFNKKPFLLRGESKSADDREVAYAKRLADALSSLMVSAPHINTKPQLKYTQEKVGEYLAKLDKLVEKTKVSELKENIKPLLQQWKKIALIKISVFQLKEEEVLNRDSIGVRVKIYDRNSKWLVAAAHATIGVVQSEIKTSAEQTDAQLRRNGIALAVLAFTCALSGILLAISIGRSIGSRIEMLQYSMELHAEGKQGELPVEGSDEIGRMAIAMRKFISKINQRENELNKTHSMLNKNLDELKSAQSALLFSEKRFKDFAQVSADWLWELDADLRFSLIQGNGLDLLGIKSNQLLHKKLSEILSRENYKPIEKYFLNQISFEGVEFYWLNERGDLLRFRISGKPLFDGDRFLGYRGTGSDITESHQFSQELIYQAGHDSLTNLVNRTVFERELQALISNEEYHCCPVNLIKKRPVNT